MVQTGDVLRAFPRGAALVIEIALPREPAFRDKAARGGRLDLHAFFWIWPSTCKDEGKAQSLRDSEAVDEAFQRLVAQAGAHGFFRGVIDVAGVEDHDQGIFRLSSPDGRYSIRRIAILERADEQFGKGRSGEGIKEDERSAGDDCSGSPFAEKEQESRNEKSEEKQPRRKQDESGELR